MLLIIDVIYLFINSYIYILDIHIRFYKSTVFFNGGSLDHWTVRILGQVSGAEFEAAEAAGHRSAASPQGPAERAAWHRRGGDMASPRWGRDELNQSG